MNKNYRNYLSAMEAQRRVADVRGVVAGQFSGISDILSDVDIIVSWFVGSKDCRCPITEQVNDAVLKREAIKMNVINSNMLSIEQATNLLLQNSQRKADNNYEVKNISFQEILEQKKDLASEVKFSKHANQRLESRNINLSEEQLGRLNQGVTQARDKSINESLVMMDNLAFIVNVKNNTVVTALEQNEANNIFTNIDGAVIV